MSDQSAERINRKHTRYRCNQRLCVRYRIDRQEFIAYGRCTEVGRGGIGAEMPAGELPIAQAVRLDQHGDKGPDTFHVGAFGKALPGGGPLYSRALLEVDQQQFFT